MIDWFVKMMLPGAMAWELLEPHLGKKKPSTPKRCSGDSFRSMDQDPIHRLHQLKGGGFPCSTHNVSRYVINHLKFMTLVAVVVGAFNLEDTGSVEEAPKLETRSVLVNQIFNLRGKEYHLKVFRDGEIVVNGNHWHLDGPPGVSFHVEKFHYQAEEEALEIKVQGSIPLILDRTVHQIFDAARVREILPHLEGSREPLDTPSMRKYRISLKPGPRAG
ncbi:MAG: hypothetical protein R3257_01485 [bacterium]|nr:hypothetical protein [bacterium]